MVQKGEESGHVQRVLEIRLDCDNDVVLLKIEQIGGIACHTGRRSRFFQKLLQTASGRPSIRLSKTRRKSTNDRYRKCCTGWPATLAERKADPDSSYMSSLYAKGTDAICRRWPKKARPPRRPRMATNLHLVWEVTDLWFHSLILLTHFGLSVDDVAGRVPSPRGRLGNRRSDPGQVLSFPAMEDCIFCKIAAGDIPATRVCEDEYIQAFPDIQPQRPVHIPRDPQAPCIPRWRTRALG